MFRSLLTVTIPFIISYSDDLIAYPQGNPGKEMFVIHCSSYARIGIMNLYGQLCKDNAYSVLRYRPPAPEARILVTLT